MRLHGKTRTLLLHVRGPEGKIVSEELHDESAVLVRVLVQSVEFGNGIIKRSLGKVTSTIRRAQDLVVENGEVEGQTQTNGVRGREINNSNILSGLVSDERLLSSLFPLSSSRELGKVAPIVSLPDSIKTPRKLLHLVIEDLGLSSGGRRDQMMIEDVEDIVANTRKLLFDPGPVVLDLHDMPFMPLVLFLLLNGRDDAPGGTAGTDDILVGNRKEVALLNRELNIQLSHSLHGLDHL